MNTKIILGTALAASFGVAAIVQTANAAEVTVQKQMHTLKAAQPMMEINRKNLKIVRKPGSTLHLAAISGTVRLASNSAGRPTAANACADMTVTASEQYYPPVKAGQLRLAQYRTVKSVKATGAFRTTHACRYVLIGVPVNKKLYIGAKYSGGWSGAPGGFIQSRPVGWQNPIMLTPQHENRTNANLALYVTIVH